jgi:hypothetical protein
MKNLNNFALSSLILCLVACGGGGGGVDKKPEDREIPLTVGEGIFDVNYGQFSGTYVFLENGDFYGVHYVNGNELAGHPRGNLPENNSIKNTSPIAWANFIDDNLMHGAQEKGPSFGRTFFTLDKVDVAINGSMGSFATTSSSQKPWFSGSTSSLYFDPIPMTSLTGSYNGIMRSVGIQEPKQTVIDFIIDDAGNFSANASNCNYSGTLIQHGSTGVYDAFATATGNECTMPASLTGLMAPIAYGNDTPRVSLMLNSEDQEYTAVFVVTKQ